MMVFRPKRFPGLLIGIVATVFQIGLATFLAYRLQLTPVSLAFFGLLVSIILLLVAAALFAYWSYGCWNLHYSVNRNHVAIHWGFSNCLIPLPQIKELILGRNISQSIRIKGINWLGYHIGQARLGTLGNTLFYSAHRSTSDILYLVTPEISYAISPPQPEKFSLEFKLCQKLGPTDFQPLVGQQQVRRKTSSMQGLKWMIAAALVLNLSLFAYVFYAFPALPKIMALSYTALGEIALIGSKSEVFRFPILALLILTLNVLLASLVVKKERLGAQLCLGAGILVQIFFWVAMVRVIA